MAFLTSPDLPKMIAAVQRWRPPEGFVMGLHLDQGSDRLIVQLEYLGQPQGVVLGGTAFSTEEIHLMLDEMARKHRAAVDDRIARRPRTEPPWFGDFRRLLAKWERFINPEILQALLALFRRLDADELGMPEITCTASGRPRLRWRAGIRTLDLWVETADRFRFTQTTGAAAEHGTASVEVHDQLHSLLAWVGASRAVATT